jgi:hypothetical protein
MSNLRQSRSHTSKATACISTNQSQVVGKLVEDTQGSGVINCRTPNCSNYRPIAKLSEEEVQRIRSGNERTRKRRKSAETDAIGSNKDEFIRRGS